MPTLARIKKAVGGRLARATAAAQSRVTRSGTRCPACGAMVARYYRYGGHRAWGCPRCNASPRERLVCELLDRGELLVPHGASILHVAPGERSLVRRFRAAAGRYVPVDLHPERYSLTGVERLDLLEPVAGGPYDLIYASHVLEHIVDDRTALSNLAQALDPTGEMWIMVPLAGGRTIDGSPALSTRERERRFGQWDHVRQYGPDIADRMASVGLSVRSVPHADVIAAARAHLDVVFVASRCGDGVPR